MLAKVVVRRFIAAWLPNLCHLRTERYYRNCACIRNSPSPDRHNTVHDFYKGLIRYRASLGLCLAALRL